MNKYDRVILGENAIYSTDMNSTGINNNICVIGGTGTGKSHSIIEPTLLETSNSSLIISDPKGSLEKKYSYYFKYKGYEVINLDFVNLDKNTVCFDPVRYISCEQDFITLAHRMVHCGFNNKHLPVDPYWDNMASILLSALLALSYMLSVEGEECLLKVLELFDELESNSSVVEAMFETVSEKDKHCLAVTQWNKFKMLQNAEKTYACVMTTLATVLGKYGSEEMQIFLSQKNSIDFCSICEKKTVVFVKISDLDDSLYDFANLFYGEAFNRLGNYADECVNGMSPIPVRFILDDFATNVVICGMPRISSTIRARNISVLLALQSIQQLQIVYKEEADTIISNCDSLVFLGSNDLTTAQNLSVRIDRPVTDILYWPIGREFIMRRGERPFETERYNIRKHKEYKKVYGNDLEINSV